MRSIPRELYPFESHYLDVGGVRLHYLDEGAGEPVLCVHGNPTWSFYYRRLVTALRGSHRVVVPDHVGCGLSDRPDDDRYRYTLGRRIDDLQSLVEHLDLTDVNLVVHDWGGAIGLGWAVRQPERVARIVILNTAAFHLPAGKSLPWQLRLVRDTAVGAVMVRGLNAFARGAVHVACTRRRLTRAERNAYCAPYDSWSNRIATLRFVQDIPLAPGDPAYDVISRTQESLGVLADRPILVCWGLKDFVFDRDILEAWRRVYPDARYCEFPESGHYVLEDSADEIIELVGSFLDDGPVVDSIAP
jgi:haloalkane dehalogenase